VTDQLDIDPAGTALLVMDFQVGLVDRVADAGALLERVNPALADVRAHGGQVALVRVAFDTADPDPDTHAFLTASIFPRHAAVIAVDDLREIWT
jgi:nicotinamidase-related amidase